MKLALPALIIAALVSAGPLFAGDTAASATSTMPAQRVAGIGGFFFRSNDPVALAKWYQEKLGIDPIPAGYGGKVWVQDAGPTAFAPFPKDTTFGKNGQVWMINFRVTSLDTMVAQLVASGEKVKVDPQVYPNGRFAHLHDPDGNVVELWEPNKKS